MSLTEDLQKEDAGTSLLDELNNTPEEPREFVESEQWRPDAGESIEGVVVETFSFESKYKDAKTNSYPTIPGLVLQVDGDDTPWSVVGLHGVLRQEIEKADPQPGDRVAIIYSGEREGKEYSYQHYRFAIRRGNGSVKPVPAQRTETKSNGRAVSASTQHEPNKKPTAPKRKPGQKVAATSDDTDF